MAYRSLRKIKSVCQDLISTCYWGEHNWIARSCSWHWSGLVLLLLGICVGWHEGTQRDLPRLQTTLCGRHYAGRFTRISHLVFTTAQRGLVTLFQFSSSGNWGSEGQRILCKDTQLVSGRGSTLISSLSHWLPIGIMYGILNSPNS